MELIRIYECLCDETRLRVLHLLAQGPLCVCHFQEILREPQVKISKHLAYLRSRGLVVCERQGTWMIYALPGLRPGATGLAARLGAAPEAGAEVRRDRPVRLCHAGAGKPLIFPCPRLLIKS
jgi:DNA-binding transcriptional ArsR family regulator